jgi:hypothetical protein
MGQATALESAPPQSVTPAASQSSAVAATPTPSLEDLLAKRAASRTSVTGATGFDYIDQGPKCKGRTGRNCFLSDDQRTGLIQYFLHRSARVHGSYKDALVTVGIHDMLKKDPTSSWIAGLVLDVLSLGVSSVIAKSAKILMNESGLYVARIHTLARLGGDRNEFAEHASSALQRVTPERLKQGVSTVVGAAKEPAKAALDARLAEQASEEKAEGQAFINHVGSAVDVAFQRFDEQTPALVDDAELLLLVHALDIDNHSMAHYVALLTEKLARYRTSGVPAIGRKDADTVPMGTADRPVSKRIRDTRVVWHAYVSGHPRELMLEYQDALPVGPIGSGILPKQQPELPMKFGPAVPQTKTPQKGHVVPHEFVEIALAAHEHAWGAAPATVVVDDTAWPDPEHVFYTHLNKKAARQQPSVADVTRQAMDAQLKQPPKSQGNTSTPAGSGSPTGNAGSPKSATDVWLGRNSAP